jgi:hypothetical protein
MPDTVARVTKLLLLLASPVDGEAVAACRALGLVLSADWADFHKLGRIVEAGWPRVIPPDACPWRTLPREVLRHSKDLNERERDFLATMAHWTRPLTARQAAWLAALGERCAVAA